MRALVVGLVLFLAIPAPALAQRSLHWRSLEVRARLDADGALHVVERHAMVFSGDWNGGERVFRLEPGQQLTLEGIKRSDRPGGVSRDLVRGDLAQVDHYAFTDAKTLRWRSRLPSDPAFANTEIDYEIDYMLSGILVRRGDQYALAHDFALPEARQLIEAFSVDVDLDPVWTPPPDFVRRRSIAALSPGASVIVRADLRYGGADAPTAVRSEVPASTRLALFAALLAAVAVIVAVFIRRESAIGRFTPIPALEAIDPAWLQQRVFSLKPEEAGALWDDSVGAPEVAALLARLTAEKKLESGTRHGELWMRLVAPLESFAGYEKDLLAGLFVDGSSETSTSTIKSHYSDTGFEPVQKIKPGLLEALAAHDDFQDRSDKPSGRLTRLLFAAAAGLVGFLALTGTPDWSEIVFTSIPLVIAWAVGAVAAGLYQDRVENLGAWSISFGFVPALFLLAAALGISSGGMTPWQWLVARLLIEIAIVNTIFNLAKTRQGPRKLARRRELAAARRYFARELQQPQPQLQDAWFPWLIAFELGPKIDDWFRVHRQSPPDTTRTTSTTDTWSTTTSSGSSSSPSWSGGGFSGGRSGGGGASGSWSVAAGALAAGVASPSSSSSSDGGGGGSSGGSSSGGGGGGGW